MDAKNTSVSFHPYYVSKKTFLKFLAYKRCPLIQGIRKAEAVKQAITKTLIRLPQLMKTEPNSL